MKYNITEQAITLFEGNLKRMINIDETMAPHEQSLISMILIEKKSYKEITDFVDGILNTTKAVAKKEEVKVEEKITTSDKLKTVNITEIEIEDFSKGQITIKDGTLRWRGEVVNNKKLIDFIAHYKKAGADITFIEKFMEKLYSNPDQKARDDIFNFIVNRCGILADGDFVAYKRVKMNYKDCHSGTMDNSIGKTVSMDRKKCDSNPRQTCSAGLHVCTKGYLGHFGGDRVVLCKVNPRDVVAIPADYSAMKMRCCEYKVVGEVKDQKDFNDIVEKLYLNPNDMSWMKTDLKQDSAENITKNVSIQQTIILEVTDIISTLKEIFQNDSKILSSFRAGENAINAQEFGSEVEKQKALETELLARALKLRPGNAKMKVAIDEWKTRQSQVVEAKREVDNTVQQTTRNDNFDIIKKLNEIFCTDSNMLKSFAVAIRTNDALEFESDEIKQQTLIDEMIIRAQKLRPSNTKFKGLIEEYEEYKQGMNIQKTDSNPDMYIPEEQALPETDVLAVTDLIETFSTDSKVAKALEKVQAEEGKSLFQAMIDKIKKIRPDSAKLKKFLEGNN